MKEYVSKFLFALSVGVCGAAVVLTGFWIYILATADGWAGLAFMVFVPMFAGAAFLLAAVPSAVMYSRTRARRDLRSLWLSAASTLFLGAEVVATFYAPLHGC